MLHGSARMRRSMTAVIALSLAAGTAGMIGAAGPAGPATRAPATAGLRPMDLFHLSQATDPQISPDGRTVAYVRSTDDVMIDDADEAIWLVDTRTGAQLPLTGVAGDTSQPQWSPDSRRLAFVAKAGKGPRGLFVLDARSGLATHVADLPRSVSALSWSRDGSQIAFVMHVPAPAETLGAPLAKPAGAIWAEPLKMTTRVIYRQDGRGDLEPGYDHVFVVAAAAGGTPRQVTSGAFTDAGPLAWAPDGASLLFNGRRGPDWERENFRSAIYRVALADGALTRLTRQDGPAASAALSPDGALIAFSSFDDTRRRSYENRLIYVMRADGGDVRPLGASLDRSLDHPRWAADGRGVYADYDDRGVTKVARLDLSGGIRTVATDLSEDTLDLPYTGGEFSLARDGTIAIAQGSSGHPPDLAIVRGGRTTLLTHLDDALLAGRTLGRVTPLPVVSAYDKLPIGAWMVTPPDFDPARRYPLILEIHGGPFLSYGPFFATDMQLYAAAGYVVVYANSRGSTSYGEAFANRIDRDYPSHDYDDLMSVVDAAIGRSFVDPDRLFVTGGSSGGIMTAWIVGKTHRFRAAVAQRPAVDWASQVLTSDSGVKIMTNWFGRTPWQDPQGYWAHSPLSLIGNVTTPTLVVSGDRDVRTPTNEAEQLYGALQMQRVPTGLIKVPGAFHEMSARPSHSAAKSQAVLGWFARYDVEPH